MLPMKNIRRPICNKGKEDTYFHFYKKVRFLCTLSLLHPFFGRKVGKYSKNVSSLTMHRQKGNIMNDYRRTHYSKRRTYIYRFADGTRVELIPGKDGVTEEHIKKNHSLDDSIVYNNLKNSSRVVKNNEFVEEEPEGDMTKESYIKERKTKRIWNLPFNPACGDEEIAEDKSGIMSQACDIYGRDGEVSEDVERLREVIEYYCTEKQKAIYRLMYIEGYKQTAIAKVFGVSDAAIHKQNVSILKIIEKYYHAA